MTMEFSIVLLQHPPTNLLAATIADNPFTHMRKQQWKASGIWVQTLLCHCQVP